MCATDQSPRSGPAQDLVWTLEVVSIIFRVKTLYNSWTSGPMTGADEEWTNRRSWTRSNDQGGTWEVLNLLFWGRRNSASWKEPLRHIWQDSGEQRQFGEWNFIFSHCEISVVQLLSVVFMWDASGFHRCLSICLIKSDTKQIQLFQF